jgi:ankyrin repeat protein
MEFLLERGANINAQNNRGSTALHLLCLKRFDTQGFEALIIINHILQRFGWFVWEQT